MSNSEKDNRHTNWLETLNASKITFIILIVGIFIASIQSSINFNLATDTGKLNAVLGLLILISTSFIWDYSHKILKLQKAIDELTNSKTEQISSQIRQELTELINVKTNNILNRVDQQFNATFLGSETQIVEYLGEIQETYLHRELLVVVYNQPKSPEALLENLYALMKDRASVSVTRVLVINDQADLKALGERVSSVDNKETSDGDKANNDRDEADDDKAHNNKSIADRINTLVKISSNPSGVDVFIIGRTHVVLNLSHPSGTDMLYQAIVIHDELITDLFKDWFRRDVEKGAIDFSEYIENQKDGKKSS